MYTANGWKSRALTGSGSVMSTSWGSLGRTMSRSEIGSRSSMMSTNPNTTGAM